MVRFSFLVIFTFTNAIFADPNSCSFHYIEIFRIAAENTWYAKYAVGEQKKIALEYKETAPGPFKVQPQDYINWLDEKNYIELTALSNEQEMLQILLENQKNCFPGLNTNDVINISKLLSQ